MNETSYTDVSPENDGLQYYVVIYSKSLIITKIKIPREYAIYAMSKESDGYTRVKISYDLRMKILARDDNKCQMCGRSGNEIPLAIHHICEVRNGGQNDPNNLVTLCWNCHVLHHQREDLKRDPGHIMR